MAIAPRLLLRSHNRARSTSCALRRADARRTRGGAALTRVWLGALRLAERLSPRWPYLVGEVVYAVRHEYCRHASDFLLRRTRLAFIDEKEAEACIDGVVGAMASELGWSAAQRHTESERARADLLQFIARD